MATITSIHTNSADARIQDLQADLKRVYDVGPKTLADLADKYGVNTTSLTFAKANPNPIYDHIGMQAFGSKSRQKEIMGKPYATIKTLLRAAGA